MLVPGLTFGAGSRVAATIGAGTTPNFFSQGVGFMTGGNLAIDTSAPAGSSYRGGIRMSSAGAVYGTTSVSGTDIWFGGLRISALGQLVYEAAAATNYANGNPITANGRLAVN